jgi:hypothetical protein
MILFSINTDEQTRAYHNMLSVFDFDIYLLGGDATREQLEANLRATDLNLLASCHGNHKRIKDQNDNVALDESNVGLLQGRKAFIFACRSATLLGHFAAQKNSTYFGYISALSAPPVVQEVLDVAFPILEFIFKNFAHTNKANVQNFLNDVKVLSEKAIEQFDQVFEGTDYQEDLDTLLFFKQVWNNLRVWFPMESEPIKHSLSSGPLTEFFGFS